MQTGALRARAWTASALGAQWYSDAAALTAALTGALGKAAPDVRSAHQGLAREPPIERVVDALAADSAAKTGAH